MQSTSLAEEWFAPCNAKLTVSAVTEQPSIRLELLQHALHGRAYLSFFVGSGLITHPIFHSERKTNPDVTEFISLESVLYNSLCPLVNSPKAVRHKVWCEKTRTVIRDTLIGN